MDKKARSSKIAILITALFLTAVLPITSVNAAPDEASEFFYGVEYDWSSIDSDLTNFTGLDLPEIFSEVMGAADDSGFNLIVGQIMTGSSNVYIHHTEDITPQTIQNLDGDSVSVWSRTTDVTLRHGALIDGILMTDWSEQNFGSEPTSFDVDVASSSQSILSVDILYKEYLDDSYNLIGADMEFSMNSFTSTNLDFDATLQGGGEELPIDFNTELSFGYSITDSTSQWRVDTPDPIYLDLSSSDDYQWNANGGITGDYDGSIDYSMSVTGIPTEQFGFDSGEFDIEISDALTQNNGQWSDDSINGEFNFVMGDDMTVDLGDGNGMTSQVQSCESCPPGNPLMFIMMGNVIIGASEAFVDDIGESFSEGLSENLIDIFDFSSDEDDEDDESLSQDYGQYCDNGQWIWSYQVGNEQINCDDGSDESFPFVYNDYYYFETLDNQLRYRTSLNVNQLSPETETPLYQCDDGTMIEWNLLNDENWQDFDCESGEDEYDYVMIEDSIFTCEDDLEIPLSNVNDGTVDCVEGEDEPEFGNRELSEWYCEEDEFYLRLSEVNNGVVDCIDGWDEPQYEELSDWYCEEDDIDMPLSEVNNGVEDCTSGLDEPQYDSFGTETNQFECYDVEDFVLISQVNDGIDDCPDGSDEPEYGDIDYNMFRCNNIDYIAISLVNDGIEDCPDGRDEPEYEYNVELSEFDCYDSVIPLSEVNDQDLHPLCDGLDEPSYIEGDVEILFTCTDGIEIPWSKVNDGFGNCNDFADEGEKYRYILNFNLLSEYGNVLNTTSYDICDSSLCQGQIDSSYHYVDTQYNLPLVGGYNTYCFVTEMVDASTNEVIGTSELECESEYYGPSIYANIDSEGNEIQFRAFSSQKMNFVMEDVDMEVTITDPNGQVIYSSTTRIDENNGATTEDEGVISPSMNGEYCINTTLTQVGQTDTLNSHLDCEDFSDEGRPSDTLTTIGEAFYNSNIFEVLQTFGENLEQRLENTEPLEEFPYNDGLWVPMWSNEYGAMVGVGVYAMDDDGAYTMAGPDTVGYLQEAPAKMSIRYLTGVEASNAASSMEDAKEIGAIVDLEQHDLVQITQDLEDAGIDTSGLDLPTISDIDDEVKPETAVESAEDDGLLPFASPISVIAVIALAGAIISSRKEEQ